MDGSIAGLEFEVLPLKTGLDIVLANGVAWRQHLDAMHGGNIQQHAARENRRVLLRAAFFPHPAAEMFFIAEAVEDLSAIAKMVERVDMVPQWVYIEMPSPE